MKLKALFVPTSNSGVTYYRMYNFWVGAHRTGIADFRVLWWQKGLSEVHPWERDVLNPAHTWRITKELQERARVSDVIIFGMLHGPGFKRDNPGSSDDYINESLAVFRAIKDMFPEKPIISEIDDNMLATPTYNPADAMYGPGQELRNLAVTQFKESDALIVSTPYLVEVYESINPNLYVVPNCIDFKLWNSVKKRSRPGLRIGWAGGASHEDDLRILEKVIPKIREKHNVVFVFLHGCPHYLRGLPGVEYVPKWSRIDRYPQTLASLGLDIGIAPLIDSAFNRGKSNLRWLEYSALGIPSVMSNVGHFKATVHHGTDGYLADDEHDFVAYLDTLISKKEVRKLMGNNAYARVFQDFNVDTMAAHYADLLGRIVREFKSKRPLEVVQ